MFIWTNVSTYECMCVSKNVCIGVPACVHVGVKHLFKYKIKLKLKLKRKCLLVRWCIRVKAIVFSQIVIRINSFCNLPTFTFTTSHAHTAELDTIYIRCILWVGVEFNALLWALHQSQRDEEEEQQERTKKFGKIIFWLRNVAKKSMLVVCVMLKPFQFEDYI